MLYKELVNEVQKGIIEEKKEFAKEEIKEKLLELKEVKKILSKLEKQFNELLEKDIEDDE